MKPALTNAMLSEAPQQWNDFSQGEMLEQQLEHEFNLWWPRIFGYHLLKVGDLSCAIDTSACSIRHQINLSTSAQRANVIADPDDLPFIEHSVDAVLLSHCLEFTQDPHHVIREAHRVLIPDGYLLLSGFNPCSMVGLLNLWPGLHRRRPWNGRFFSPSRVKDWLHLLGFEIISERRMFCRTMLGKQSKVGVFTLWLEKHLHYFGSAYVLIARKRTLPLTPIKPKWQLAAHFNPAVKGVSAKISAKVSSCHRQP